MTEKEKNVLQQELWALVAQDTEAHCLKISLKQLKCITVKYLRPGGIAYCKSEGKKYYGILTGTQIISLNKEGEPDYMDLQTFLDLHDAEKLKVATRKRIAVGCHEVDYIARMAVEEEIFPSTKVLVLKCLAVDGAVKVDEAIEERFGSFEWLNCDIPEKIRNSGRY